MLSHVDIERELDGEFADRLVIEPLGENAIQPASVDLRIADEILLWRRHRTDDWVDLAQSSWSNGAMLRASGILESRMFSDDGTFELESGNFALASTVERVEIPSHLVARFEGRSSLGRMGLLVHATAGFIDPGFRGQITLELYNANPNALVLHRGMRIAQLSLFELRTPVTRPYAGKYQDQIGPTPSRIAKDFE